MRQLLTDTGNVLGSRNYDPYGQVESGSTLTSTFGYDGQLQDGTTGSEYLRARWYQPGTGTLLGVDPALGGTGQPYAYAADDPVNGSDPSGDCTFPGGQLAGIDGAEPCDPSIQQALTGSQSTVGGGVQANQAAFTAALNQELASAATVAQAGGNLSEAVVLNPGQCPNPNACSYEAFSAQSVAGNVANNTPTPNSVVARGGASDITGLYLGVVTGTSSQVSVGVLVVNGLTILAVSIKSPGQMGRSASFSCGVLGLAASVAIPIGRGAVAGGEEGSGAGPEGLLAGVIVGAIVAAIGLGISVATSSTSTTRFQQVQNRGAIQIQGTDIDYGTQQIQLAGANRRFGNLPVHKQGDTLSSPWDRTTPLSAAEGRSRLALLWTYLNATQRRHRQGVGTGPNRVGAYSRAVDYINRCLAAGGCTPPGGVDFHDDNRSDTSYRIDIPIFSGVAFDVP